MRIHIHTFGCKVNQYESQSMAQRLRAAGFEAVPEGDEGVADVVLFNTCTVTGESERKLRQAVRRCRRERPQAAVVLCGCMPRAFPAQAAAMGADLVLTAPAGEERDRTLLAWLEEQRTEKVKDGGLCLSSVLSPLSPGSRTRAFVKIEDGCERFCTYCIVPHARGGVRSKPLPELREELAGLARAGFAEVVLVGIALTAYGRDFSVADAAPGEALCAAVEAACATPGIRRVRLGSLDPRDMHPAMIARLQGCAGLCPHFHLSLQSGCDDTLRRMGRTYTAADYRAVAERLRAAFPGCALTTDVIVGFPGEDGAAFRASYDFVEAMAFAKVHVFPFSPRSGTPAATMDGQVSREETLARAREMGALAARLQADFARSLAGTRAQVLVEREGMGYTRTYVPVRVAGGAAGETAEGLLRWEDGELGM